MQCFKTPNNGLEAHKKMLSVTVKSRSYPLDSHNNEDKNKNTPENKYWQERGGIGTSILVGVWTGVTSMKTATVEGSSAVS